jgi:hypothetical protein
VSAAATQRSAIVELLRFVGEDGAPESQMALAGGMWWRKRVDELRKEGILISEDRGRCYRVNPDVERTIDTADSFPAADDSVFPFGAASSVGGSLSIGSIEAVPSGDRPLMREAGLPRPDQDQAGGIASIDTELTLFPRAGSPYDVREAA